jgi:hypothetical protein
MKFSYNKSKKLLTNKLLTNKYFLYFVLILSCFYLLYLLLEKRFNLIIVFALISYIIYCFNKNMIIVLGISLIITFISTLGMKVKEGLENNTTSTTPAVSAPKTSSNGTNGTTSSTKLTASTVKPTATTPATTTPPPATTTPEATTTTESMDSMSRKRGRLDETAASINDTNGDLENILGQTGNMNTEDLLKQQAQLTEAMKNMGPLIESAKTLMNGMNFDGLNNLASSLVSKKQ